VCDLQRPARTRKAKESSVPPDVYRPLGGFRRALREFLAFSEAGALDQGITSQQHQALLAIKAHDAPQPMTVSGLAECLLIKTHSAVGLVARLADRGLVERRVSSTDRRRVQLSLTPTGDAVLETITRANLSELEGLARNLRDLLESVRELQRGTGAPGA
jgi:DNA-binding MarR family transcriptional regulator